MFWLKFDFVTSYICSYLGNDVINRKMTPQCQIVTKTSRNVYFYDIMFV